MGGRKRTSSSSLSVPITALAVAWIGYSVNLRQASDTDVRLYAELLGRREEVDRNFRKDMFNSVLESFVESSRSRLFAVGTSRAVDRTQLDSPAASQYAIIALVLRLRRQMCLNNSQAG
jgi:hypothetical protein